MSALEALEELAERLGVPRDEWTPWGPGAAKLALEATQRPARGKLVLVTAMSPTSHGEGKTVTAIGLADALRARGVRAVCALRQPATGPLLGQKGGGSGGGRARLVPQQYVDLHFTGDLHAVAAAQDLVAAMTDDHLHRGNALGLDLARATWPRAIDLNDRALRRVVTGIGGPTAGPARESLFVSTAACEVMAVLALATGPRDLRERLARCVVGFTREGRAITAGDVGASGGAAALLADALRPNLVATAEGTPALVHAGPFANVSHGTSSVLAARAGLAHADVVVTEAGFGADLGAEKFVDLVAPQSGLAPDLAVLVVSLRALKEQGAENLDAHLGILGTLGLRAVVAVNRFPEDAPAEVDRLLARLRERGVQAAAHTVFADGAAGGIALADVVRAALAQAAGGTRPRPLYPPGTPVEEALRIVATRIYGAAGISLEAAAQRDLARLRAAALDRLPVCVAKTPVSLSDDADAKGAPRGWTLRVRELRPSAGAGYVVAVCGDIQLMPGLGLDAAARRMDLDDAGRVVDRGIGAATAQPSR